MKKLLKLSLLLVLLAQNFIDLAAQGADCVDALVICTDGAQSFTPQGSGMNDFANPANDNGCLSDNENQSAWYYFEFQSDMSPGSMIGFTLTPDGGFGEDYDFAIYGPNVDCDNLGQPIRCSYAAQFCGFCPDTGLGNGTTDFSEGAAGDGFVAAMTVNPGEGYYLIIDNWLGSSTGFNLNWTNSAAPYLDCNVGCDLEVMASPPTLACAGGDPVTLFPIVTGNTGNETYLWTSPSGIGIINDPFSPNPTISFPDNVMPGAYEFTLTVTDGECEESVTFIINVSALMVPTIFGNPFFCENGATVLSVFDNFSSVIWSNGTVGNTSIVTTPGQYTVTVTDLNGCTATNSIDIIEQPSPDPTINGISQICPGDIITLSVEDLDAINFFWSNNETSESIIVNTPGIYSVTSTNSFGCEGVAFFEITLLPEPITIIDGNTILCTGESTVLSTDFGFSSYLWSTGETSEQITVSEAGTYSLTVTNAEGCQAETSVDVMVYSSSEIEIIGDTAFCEDADVTLEGPVGNMLSYEWSTGSIDPVIDVQTGGTYILTVTDVNGCSNIDSVIVTEYDNPEPIISGKLNICDDESAVLNVGDNFIAYNWSTGDSIPEIVVNTENLYEVTVTDINGCVGTTSHLVTINTSPTPEIMGEDLFCAGDSTMLNTDDGFVHYEWSNGDSTQTISINLPGNYDLTVTDVNGCQGTTSISVAGLPIPVPDIIGNALFCSGENTQLQVDSFSTYLWSNGASAQIVNIDAPGELSIIVTDVNGCQGVDTIQIEELPLPSVNIIGDLDICQNESTIISQEPLNNTYSYIWNNGSSTSSIEVSQPGEYSLTITDDNGCTNSSTVELIQFTLPEPEILGDDAYCYGESTNLTANAGYDIYQWSNGGIDQNTNIDSPGIYTLQVTDANGCQGIATIEITELEIPVAEITGETNFCAGASTTLSVNAFNSYAWSNGITTQINNINTPGELSIIVTDANGCQGVDTIQIIEHPLPLFSISGNLDFCSGESTTLNVDTGFENYQWNNGQNSSTIEVSEQSVFSVTVTDIYSCSNSDFVNTTVFPLPIPSITGDLQFCEGDSTALEINGNFDTYIWNENIASVSIIVNNSGTYTASVIDENACVGTTSVDVEELATPIPTIGGITSICSGASAELDVEQTYAFYNWSTGSNEASITASSPGIYSVSIIDNSGCEGFASIDVQVNDLPTVSINGLSEICEGEQTILDAGDGFAAYQWSDNSTAQTLDVTAENTYSLTVTDENGCQNNAAFSVMVNALPTPTISGDLSFCSDDSSTLTATAGFQSYLWNTGEISTDIQINSSGIYSLSVSDQLGCEGEAMVEVEVFDLPLPIITGDLEFCEGESTTLSVNDTYESYQWSNGSNAPFIIADATDTFSLIVTDENGCTGQAAESVIAHPIPQFDIQGETSFCAGQSINIGVQENFEEYIWSNGANDAEIVISNQGQYSIDVIDINGCSNNAEVTIIEYPLPVFDISAPSFFCENEIANLIVEEGFAAYSWSTGATDPSIAVDEGGAFGVTITNNFGCTDSSMTMIAKIPLPIANAGNDGAITCDEPSIHLDGSNSSAVGQIQFMWEGPGITPLNINQESPEVSIPGLYYLSILDIEYQCQSIVSEVIVLDNTTLPNISIQEPDTLNCINESVIVDASNSDSGSNFQYQWYQNGSILDGEDDNSLTVLESSILTLFVTNMDNGCVSSESIEVFEDSVFPIADAGNNMHIDCNTPTAYLIGNNSETGSHIQLAWSTLEGNIISGANTATPLINQAGQYIITVLNTMNMCFSEDSVLVTQDFELPTADAGYPQELDCLNPTVTLDGTNSSSGSNFVASWMTFPDSNFISSAKIIEVSNEGLFVLTILNLENGCESSDNVIVTNNPVEPTDLEYTLDNPTCLGFEDGSIHIDQIVGGTPPYLFSFNGAPFSNNTSFSNLFAGEYPIILQDAMGCELSIDLLLEDGNDLAIELGEDQYINLGEAANINAQSNVNINEIVNLNWTGIDSLACSSLCFDLDVLPFITSVYTATIIDDNGCTAEDNVTVFVNRPYEVFIPNAFSPNNDGHNDRLTIFAGEDVVKIKTFNIFNRWGELVYEVYNFPPNDLTFGWEGKYRSKEMNSAVFAYVVEVEFIDGEVKLFTGDISLLR